MREVRKIDFFNNERTRNTILVLSLVLLVPYLLIYFLNAEHFDKEGFALAQVFGLNADWGIVLWYVVLFAVLFVVLMVHELIHGALFKLLGDGTKVIFGYKKGMLYASSPNSVYTKARFCIVLMGPTVILSTLFIVLALCGTYTLLVWSLFFLHLSGCSGDLLAIYYILQTSECTHCEDTDYGVRLLH